MPGNVLVDDIEAEEAPPRPSPWWMAGLGALVVVVLMALPGQPETDVVPTTVTVPEVVVPEDRWSVVELPGTGVLTDVTATAEGYVAVGEGPQIWWSNDRATWEWVKVPGSAPGGTTAVASFGDGAVAVGSTSGDGVVLDPAVWRTQNGPDWEEVAIPVEGPAGLEGIVAADGRLVAWGWKGSPADFSPEAEPLLLISDDGTDWRAIEMVEHFHISSVTWLEGAWYASGFAIGRAALWSSPDLEQWTQVPTDEMLFGWDIRRLSYDGALVADLIGLNEEGFRRWRRLADGSWEALESEPGQSFEIMASGQEEFGVGGGRLWANEAGGWAQVDLMGEVTAAAEGVVVGGQFQQPTIWVDDTDAVALLPTVSDGQWETVTELGEGGYAGAWPVADGWVVAGATRWWFVDETGVEPVVPPAPTWTIQEIGEEWVALPSMHWTSDGVTWEERAQPWEMEGPAQLGAVSEVDGDVVAVGRNRQFLWAASVSSDQGRTWELVSAPASATPLWDVVGTANGFAATAARSRGTDEVVVTRDGLNWEPLVGGSVIVAAGDLPAAMTESGELLLLDSNEMVRPPRVDVTGVRRDGDRLVVTAGGRLWVGPGEWQEIPVDPPHGIAGQVDPIPLGGRLLVVGADRESLRILEWRDD